MPHPRRPLLPPAWGHLALQRGLRLLVDCDCLHCGSPEGDPLCPACLAALPRLPRRRCPRCLGSLDRKGACPLCTQQEVPIEAVTALGQYTGSLRQAIRAMKYRGRADIGLVLGSELAKLLAPLEDGPWLVVPVPIHGTRRAERGYNQVEPLAWQLARQLGHGYDGRAVRRLGRSQPFYQQGRTERWLDAQSAFHARADRLAGRSVIVVDDILTSGATLWAMARAVRAAGACRVRGAVLARATMQHAPSEPPRLPSCSP